MKTIYLLKKFLLFLALFSFLISPTITAQTITSTTGGGLWDKTTTWVGGVVPGTSSAVVVNGPVYLNGNFTCSSITINSAGSLYNDNFWNSTLTVTGNLVNSGKISSHPTTGYKFYLSLKGNIENNGIWTPQQTSLEGNSNQTIKQGSGKRFEGYFLTSDAIGDILLGSDVTFYKNRWDLSKSKILTNGFKLTTIDYFLNDGFIVSNDNLLLRRTILNGITFNGNYKINGNVFFQNNNIFNDTAVLNDTIQNDAFWNSILTINGKVINNGRIINHPTSGYKFYLNCFGDIENNGIWRHNQTTLSSTNNQKLKQSSGKYFEGYFVTSDSIGDVILESDIAMLSNTWSLNRSKIIANNFTLTTQNYVLDNGKIYSTGKLNFKNTIINKITIDGNYSLEGKLKIQDKNFLQGIVTLTDTIQNDIYWNSTLNIVGKIINNGRITNHPSSGYKLYLNILSDIENNGIWKPQQTSLSALKDQKLKQTKGKYFEGYFLTTDSIGDIILDSDISMLANAWELSRSKILANNYTFETQTYTISNGKIYSTGKLNLKNTIVSKMTFDGSYVFEGKLRIQEKNYLNGIATLADTIQNDTHWNSTLTINGKIINNGSITNHPTSGYKLNLNVLSDIENNGIWKPQQTSLSSLKDQKLKQAANKSFEGYFLTTDSIGDIILSSNISFSGNSWDLNNSKIRTNGFNFNTRNYQLNNGKIISNEKLILQNTIFSKMTLDGIYSIEGKVRMQNNNVLKGLCTLTDTIHNDSYYNSTLDVRGKIINNGKIINHPSTGYRLYLAIFGDVVNNGKWAAYQTIFSGKNDKTIRQKPGVKFEGYFTTNDTICKINLGSNVLFGNNIWDMNKSKIYTKGFKLNSENYRFNNGVIFSSDTINLKNTVLSAMKINGDFKLKGKYWMHSGNILSGNVTNIDTIYNEIYSNPTLVVFGNLVNKGLISNHPTSGYRLTLNIHGSITNNGKWASLQVNLVGSGERTIRGMGISSTIRAEGTKITFTGDNFLPNLNIIKPTRCILENGTLIVESGTITGELENKGKITTRRKIGTTTQDYGFFAATARILTGSGLDSLIVISHGHQVTQTFANAVKSWWSVSPVPSSAKGIISSLTLSYTDAELGTHNESNIQLYHSADKGMTWTQVSTSMNTTRNAANNTIAVTNVPASGEYLLSAVADPISVRPSIVVGVIGSPQIRILAPNRHTVHYVNNSDFPTDDFLLSVNVGTHLRVLKTEHPQADGKLEVIPFEDLSFEGEDTTFVFYCAGMGPREERTFNVITTANTIGLKKASGVLLDPITITVGTYLIKAAAVYATVKTIDYIGSKAKEGLELTPEQKKQWEKNIGEIPQELKRKDTKKEWAMKTVGKTIIEKSMGLIGGTVDVARAVGRNLKEVAPNLRRKVFGWLYKESGLYGVEEKVGDVTVKTEVTGATQMKAERVTSKDPNEKVAPAGFGPKGFISTAGRMNYRILFENIKTAQAAAWQVIIVDTLSAEFDPATVEFGITSHEGPSYEWKKTQTGNILRWEIAGIELPPNITPPEGEGYVTFSVKPKANLPSGTVFRNRAEIVFDLNRPIVTNTVVNTLDFTPPTTIMQSLPATYSKDSLEVRWQSSDGSSGSGIESVVLFASKDGGPFVQVGTTFANSLKLKVAKGTYKFYGLATDNVGNVESVQPAISQTMVTEIVKTEDIPVAPSTFELHQNYPNPFRTTTTISYSLPSKSFITLRVFDALGREKAILQSEQLPAGKYTQQWNAEGLPSGVYYYQLRVGDRVQTKKLLLLK